MINLALITSRRNFIQVFAIAILSIIIYCPPLIAQQDNFINGWVTYNNDVVDSVVVFGDACGGVDINVDLVAPNGTQSGSTQTDAFNSPGSDPIFGPKTINYDCCTLTVDTPSVFNISATRDGDYLNGVNTFDLVVLSRHILGTDPITNPFILLAGDVDLNGVLDNDDLQTIRELILFINTELPGTSWRFISRRLLGQPFFVQFFLADPFNTPVAYPGYTDGTYSTLASPSSQIFYFTYDFGGYKMGDLNQSAVANFQGQAISADRSAVVADYQRGALTKGSTVISVSTKDLASWQVIGSGFTIDESKATFLGMSSDLAGFDSNAYHYKDGELRMLWYDINKNSAARSAASNAQFDIHLQLKEGVTSIEDVIQFDANILPTEFYDEKGQLQNPSIDVSAQTFKFAPQATITPSPTNGPATLNLQLPTATLGQIQVFDMSGKLLLNHQQAFQAGQQQYLIPNIENLPSGVLAVKVQAGDWSETIKLVKE